MQAKLTRTIAVAAVLAVLGAAGRADADDASAEVWLISTRRAPGSGQVETGGRQIRYWRLQADNQWLSADSDALLADGDRPLPITVFIPGNRAGRTAAVRIGWHVYHRVKRHAEGRPFRFVIWSWPSDRIRGGARRDVRLKACRSDVESYYLAECLDRVDPDLHVSLIGYSLGARVITGALHLLAGGQVAGRSLPEQTEAKPKPSCRAVLVAAGLDADWLLPGHRNGLALSQVERVLVTSNCCDPALRWYPLMYRRGGPQALGYAGPACGGRTEKIELIDLTCSVGRIHDSRCYLAAAELRRRLAWYTFFEPPDP